MRYELPGQEDVWMAFGAPGDKTILFTAAATHVRLQNYDPQQPVMYSLVDPPTLKTHWKSLKPDGNIMVWLNGGTKVYLRKKRWIRGFSVGAKDAAGASVSYPDDVTASVEVEEVNMS